MDEIAKVRERYARRAEDRVDREHDSYVRYNLAAAAEREMRFAEIIRNRFDEVESRKVLEIGAGNGMNLVLFRRLGFRWENVYANELLDAQLGEIRYNVPQVTVLPGNAAELPHRAFFDVVLQSTVFTSLLDDEFKRTLARRLLEMLTDDGIVLWYDFKYDNPRNRDVRGIGRNEIRRLFVDASSIRFYSATLAPPIGRRLGRGYGLVNSLAPFLRSHLVAVVSR